MRYWLGMFWLVMGIVCALYSAYGFFWVLIANQQVYAGIAMWLGGGVAAVGCYVLSAALRDRS